MKHDIKVTQIEDSHHTINQFHMSTNMVKNLIHKKYTILKKTVKILYETLTEIITNYYKLKDPPPHQASYKIHN